MTEVDREMLLAERLEEMAKKEDRRRLKESQRSRKAMRQAKEKTKKKSVTKQQQVSQSSSHLSDSLPPAGYAGHQSEAREDEEGHPSKKEE
jgi:hypothetical protein